MGGPALSPGGRVKPMEGWPAKALGVVDDTQCFAPIFNDSPVHQLGTHPQLTACELSQHLANLVKSLVKQRGRMVRRIALRNFCREELFDGALKIFVYLFLVVRQLQSP